MSMNIQFSRKVPLYHASKHRIPTNFQHVNAGLWYNKFCNTWTLEYDADNKKWKDYGRKKYKAHWLDAANGKTVGDMQLLKEAKDRMRNLVNHKNGKMLHMKLTSRLAIGLGNPNPTENGFTFHHIYGTPYLPSSSVKGMVRAWATQWMKADQTKVDRIFGPDGKEEKEIGQIIFMDAFPVHPVKLEKEMINVLYKQYYRKSAKFRPIDSYSPELIPFLSVASNQTFLFSFVPRAHYDQVDKDVHDVQNWLIQALQWIGIGAKTSNGYGRFIEDPAYD
ncbi:type III-B CRISPR module RAMP protein Cmr6 [Laceyella tengchongensis]|jgi:CRISPR-associated protein Cmr6